MARKPIPADLEQFRKWTAGLEDAKTNPDWDKYDSHIQETVSRYNEFLSGKGGFVPLAWQLIKAICWTETGAHAKNHEWDTRPMQIGIPGDPGMWDILHHQHRSLILPPQYLNKFTDVLIRHNPLINIEAGTGLIFLRLALFGFVTVPESTLVPLAIQHQQVTRHRAKPKKKIAIVGWRPATFQMIFMRYNTRDLNYPNKLAYCVALMRQIQLAQVAK